MSEPPLAHAAEHGDCWSLPELLDALPAPDAPITDGRPYLREEAPNVFVVQGVGYLPIIHRMWETFAICGFPERGQADYLAWRDGYLKQAGEERFTPDLVSRMSRRELMYLLRTIQRGERFCDGSWKSAHRQGLFHAIIGRWIALAGG